MPAGNRIELTLFPAAAPPSPAAGEAPAPAPGLDPGQPGPGSRPAAAIDLGPVDAGQLLDAVRWLRWGRCRGLASEALLFAALSGRAPEPDAWHGRTVPSCRAEIYRCLRLTADLPWTRRGLEPLAAAYRPWAALRNAWDDLTAAIAAEVGPTWPLVDLSSGRWPDITATEKRLRQALAQGGVQI